MTEPKREYLDFLQDILTAMDKVLRFAEGVNFEQLVQNDEKLAAVILQVQIIGEAAKQIPAEVKLRYPEIPWKDITGIRDKVVHAYFAINDQKLWETATIDIPRDKPLVERALEEEKRRRSIEEKKE